MNFLAIARAVRHSLATGYWLAVIAASIVVFLSLDLGAKHAEYRASIAPDAAQSGSVRIVFYGKDFDKYLSSGNLTIPTPEWQITRGTDSTVLAAQAPASGIHIVAHDTPINLALVHHAQGGTLSLDDRAGHQRLISLRSANETISSLTIGGPDSSVPSSGEVARYGRPARLAAAAAIFALLFAIAWRMARSRQEGSPSPRPPGRTEIALFALPFLLATSATLIAFVPGNVSYDGSLQWIQAAQRGELFEPLGYPTTYFMRLFTQISSSPLPLLVLQSVLAAWAMALLLHELRHRGVPFLATLAAAMILAITPQYFSFFTNLGKDPLSLIGVLFFSWALLNLFRQPAGQRASWGTLCALIGGGLFAGLMRVNALPIMLLVLVLALALLFRHGRRYSLIGAGVLFLAASLVIPRVLSTQAAQEIKKYQSPAEWINTPSDTSMPLGMFTNLSIYHLFGAAMAHDIPVPDKDTEPFFAIIPRDKWKDYSCYMTDTTVASIGHNTKFSIDELYTHLRAHQIAMAATVVKIALKNPGLLLDRQACITRVLWQIGVGQRPFQTTSMLGYDTVDKRFPLLAGESRTLWPSLRQGIQDYQLWTEGAGRFWLFWKPALPLFLGFFVVGIYLAQRRDIGVALVALVPLLSFAQLLLIIPFPAYRYVYPSVLILMTLTLLVFSRRPAAGTPVQALT